MYLAYVLSLVLSLALLAALYGCAYVGSAMFGTAGEWIGAGFWLLVVLPGTLYALTRGNSPFE